MLKAAELQPPMSVSAFGQPSVIVLFQPGSSSTCVEWSVGGSETWTPAGGTGGSLTSTVESLLDWRSATQPSTGSNEPGCPLSVSAWKSNPELACCVAEPSGAPSQPSYQT